MYFNFPLFSSLVERAYKKATCLYSLEDVLSVFRHYFKKHEDAFKKVHPNIRLEQIESIIKIMPYLDRGERSSAEGVIEPEDYAALIDKHFKTRYRGCDYNINHFFSGDIRLMRYYEVLY